jgi:hypothetical protein
MQLSGFIWLDILSICANVCEVQGCMTWKGKSIKSTWRKDRVFTVKKHFLCYWIYDSPKIFNSFQLQMQCYFFCGTIYTKFLSPTAMKVDKIRSFYRYITGNKGCNIKSWPSGESPKSISQINLLVVRSFFRRHAEITLRWKLSRKWIIWAYPRHWHAP